MLEDYTKISNTRDGTRVTILLRLSMSKSDFQAFSTYNLETLATQLSGLQTHEILPSLPT